MACRILAKQELCARRSEQLYMYKRKSGKVMMCAFLLNLPCWHKTAHTHKVPVRRTFVGTNEHSVIHGTGVYEGTFTVNLGCYLSCDP